MTEGRIHCFQSESDDRMKKLFPGSNIQNESQQSPSTFAKDVNISANTTSAKSTGLVVSGNKQRERELRTDKNWEIKKESTASTHRRNWSRSRLNIPSNGQIRTARITSMATEAIYLYVSAVCGIPCVADTYTDQAINTHMKYMRDIA